jgi:hypothetical protein
LYTRNGKESFPEFNVHSDEVTYTFNGIINRHNRVYWVTDDANLTEEGAVNLPGTSVQSGMSCRDMLCRSLQHHCQQFTGAAGGHFQLFCKPKLLSIFFTYQVIVFQHPVALISIISLIYISVTMQHKIF